MKWTLIVMLGGTLGTAPIETGLVYDDLEKCYLAEKLMRAENISWLKRMREWSEKNPTAVSEADVSQTKALVGTFGICVPHSDP